MAALKPTFVIGGTPTALQSQGQQQDEIGWPDESDVSEGLAYGPSGEFTGTKAAAATFADAGEVLEGVDRGDGVLGTRVDCPEALAVLDTVYGDPLDPLVGTHTDTISFTSSDAADLFLPSVIRTALLTSGKIGGRLGPYDFGDGDEPACFTNDRYLYMARRPLIYIKQSPFSGSEGDRAARSFDAQVAIEIWGNRSASDVDLMGLAQEVWNICDRLNLNLTGWSTVDVDVQAPDRIDDPDGFPGYSVMCDINLLQEA